MQKGKTNKLLLTALAMAIIAIATIVLTTTPVRESVKRESARLFDYEYIPNQNINIDSCQATKNADSIYKDFRSKFRFHFQNVGMASFPDSSRMILLSDLPPYFETDSIAPIFANFTHSSQLRRHSIGYDGFTSDLVIILANATSENCDRLIKRLNHELFFSDYKPVVMPLPAENKRRYFANDNIDYQISLDEFNTWFLCGNESSTPSDLSASDNEDLNVETFISLNDTTTELSVSDIFASQTHGVFFSRQPGFVAWSLPKNSDIAPQIAHIRQFTLDADLILGALADSANLVIIGRERQSPIYELPPLQIESILLLAATTEKELSQSLDINDLMAGKMNNGRDWCPTYLSRELENTEFGDLMTITDVLLKDWSERGTINESHYRYPEPGYYTFDRPLFRKLGLNELVYNWNTSGAMYAIDIKNESNTNGKNKNGNNVIDKDKNTNNIITIYTLGRTGSLPVSYFNSQERSQSIGYRYESQAYHYFATLGCTDLARVVQYTALYQLFIDNNITYSGNTYPSFPKNKPFLLYKPTLTLLDTIRHLSSDKIALFADSLSKRSFISFQKERVDKQLRENEQKHNFSYTDENIDQIYNNVHRNTQVGISRSIQEVKNMLNSLSEEQFNKLAKYLSYPRGISVRDQESYNTYLRARRVNQLMREIGKNNLDLVGMDLGNVKNWYAANLSNNSGRYMKTSSLIVTYNDMMTTGGHNLSSRISRVNSMTNYKRSRGNYTPTDYEQPAQTGPVSTDSPSAKTSPSTKSTKKKTANTNTSGRPNNATKTQKHSNSTSNIRSRSAVISSAPRARRGL